MFLKYYILIRPYFTLYEYFNTGENGMPLLEFATHYQIQFLFFLHQLLKCNVLSKLSVITAFMKSCKVFFFYSVLYL